MLDFDGVILESNRIKAETFPRLFHQYPQHAEAMIKLHQDHGGMPRHEKLRIICEDILGLTVDDDEIQRLSRELGRLVDDGIMACPFTPGALDFLKTYSTQYPLFIATGTPEDEMQPLVKRRGIASYFAGVYGSPRNKAADTAGPDGGKRAGVRKRLSSWVIPSTTTTVRGLSGCLSLDASAPTSQTNSST